jgi:hypothetical protein
MAVDPGDYLPLLGVGLLAVTTIVSIAGAWAIGRARGMQDTSRLRDGEVDTHARIERIERHLETIAEEIERLGEVQRFALKVIGDKVVDASEPPRLPQGRVITPH